MTHEDYRRALKSATDEYEKLGAERQAIDKRLAELAQTVGTLTRLLGYVPTVPVGLTDAVRIVMRSGVPMTPIEVRDRLHSMGFDMEKYANDLAAVHTILKRLNESGELRFVSKSPGKHQYTLNRPANVTVLGPDILRYKRENELNREAMEAKAEEPEPVRPSGRRRKK